MKNNYKIVFASLVATSLFCGSVSAGNKDRSAEAGSSELLINPWTRSTGFGSANSAAVHGIEAQFLNVAGLAFTKKTEFMFSQTKWLQGTGINISSLGFAQRLGSSSVFGVGIMSTNYGEIQRTTVNSPDGGVGTFSPKALNLNISYAKEFSNSIYGGVNVKVLSQSISNLKQQGVALDAGIQYVTGHNKELKFGISLKNVGSPTRFSGDGLSTRATLLSSNVPLTVEQRSAKFDLPSLINIGLAYDFYLFKKGAESKSESKEKSDKKTTSSGTSDNRLTIAGNFLSNSFTRDNFQFGAEYGFKNMFMARVGYFFEPKLFSSTGRTNAFTGLSTGFSVEVPMSKTTGSSFAIDYSYRTTNPFNGCHNIGVRLTL